MSSVERAYVKASRVMHGQTIRIRRNNIRNPRQNVDISTKKTILGVGTESTMRATLVKEFDDCKKVEDDAYSKYTSPDIINRKQVSPLFPVIPDSQVFSAMLTNIDCKGVIWVVPEAVAHLLSKINAELVHCVGGVDDCCPGVMVGVLRDNRKVRARVLEVEGCDLMRVVDIDSGKVFRASRQYLRQLSPILLSMPPLAIPLKLYGIKKVHSHFSETDRFEACAYVGASSSLSNMNMCIVSVMERNLEDLPLPANVRYCMEEMVENDGNVALDLVELGLCNVITGHDQWEAEVSDHGLDWMLDPMSVPHSLAFMPHSLPLAVGQWVPVSVEGLEYPLIEGKEQEPGIETPDANRIAVQVRDFPANSTFDQFNQEISQSLQVIGPQVMELTSMARNAKDVINQSANEAERVDSPAVGQSVFVFYSTGEGGEWCRGTVETMQKDGKVTVHYTDYGHRGHVGITKMKSMGFDERMMLVQVREVKFQLPNSNQELEAIRLDLSQEEKMMMRVEHITALGYPSELEEIIVSVWRAVEGDEEGSYLLSKIC